MSTRDNMFKHTFLSVASVGKLQNSSYQTIDVSINCCLMLISVVIFI